MNEGPRTPTPIGENDISEYVKLRSDFGFELKVLKVLQAAGWRCQHAGTYEDPLTRKARQFDIRASHQVDDTTIAIAVECKNLRAEAPIVLFAVPRSQQESFHHVVFSFPRRTGYLVSPILPKRAHVIRIEGSKSIYGPTERVGKSYAQVCREVSRGEGKGGFKSTDPNIYEKWSQALSSCRDLIDEAEARAEGLQAASHFSTVIPFLVVPDGTLWAVEYADDGSPIGVPHEINWMPYFVDKQPAPLLSLGRLDCDLSHLEFVTMSGLVSRLEVLETERTSHIFPLQLLEEAIRIGCLE